MCRPRHRHDEWLEFLRLIDRKTPKHLGLHLIVGNYATHSHPDVQARLAKHRASSCTSPPPAHPG